MENKLPVKTLLTVFLSVTILTIGMAQTTRRVNNNVGISGTNVYSTAQAAHDASAANDILVIEPSSTSYGALTLNKPLKIYGNGYFLTTNTELKADQRSSTLDYLYFNTGSGGSEMYGMTISLELVIHGVSNIIISRNNVYVFYFYNTNKANTTKTNISNIIISKNYILGFHESGSLGYSISSVFVNNNIVGYITGMNDPRDQGWIIRNNTFTGGAGTLLIVNSVFENNFIYNGGGLTFTNVTYSYNVSTGATFSGGTGNVNDYDYVTNNELFGTTGYSADEAYQIKAGSQLKTLGSSGSEVGAYGGSSPYIVSGISPIPSITSMVNTGTGDNSTPIKVTVSVKSNN
jgi:hypothetical protein